jgi:mannosyltransferase OCH1-like enzyme
MKIHQILINDTNKLPNEFPEFHNICYKQIKKLYPNAEYHLYSGEELEEIIKNNFDTDVFIAYKKLRPYACKADLARLCLLYLYGGLYIDLNVKLIDTIPNLDKLDFFAFRDITTTSKRSWSVANSIIFATKKSKIMKKCIDIIVENCKNEYYGISVLDVSGCIVLGRAIMTSNEDINFIATDGELCKINPQKEKNYSYYFAYLMDKDDKIIAYRKPILNKTNNIGDISCFGFIGTNNYIEMWKDKEVYDSSIKFPTKSTLKYQ